ncbi:unnamed protein product [Ectocarpus sp. 4 AP-2014]
MATKRVSFTEERFVPCYATVTSNMSTESFQEMKYKAPGRRVFSAVAPPSSVARPNYHDALRRVAVVVYQHIKTCQWKRKMAEERERAPAETETEGSRQDNMKSWRRSAPSLAALRGNESALWGAGGRDGARWPGGGGSRRPRRYTGSTRRWRRCSTSSSSYPRLSGTTSCTRRRWPCPG